MSDVKVTFDISKTSYFIQHSTGDLKSCEFNSTNLQIILLKLFEAGRLGKHHGKSNYGSSVKKINFTINSYPTDVQKDTKSIFIKIHM